MQSKGGLADVQIVNGFATTTTSAPTSSAGGWTDTASNPGGTKTVDTYVGGVLADEHSVGTGGVSFADQSYGYHPFNAEAAEPADAYGPAAGAEEEGVCPGCRGRGDLVPFVSTVPRVVPRV